ncbi:Peptidase family M1 containing protein [Brugia malayi]|uniref:Aminopeptidase n=1 Tax=Brugia malayi TaxID=6279 RepID=A0A0H5S2I9_BRUMA|nr:Peptidase family M1 containing protein [Brugia malayi]CRZ22704.1 BMA-PAM-1 [Brugia malayi]VIO88592.1 Peptidase family M1 containing protein [Brugia malayi]
MHIKLLQFCANHSRRLLSSSSIKIISRKEMSCVAPAKFERLPELAKPTHYTLTLSPDFKNFTFRGQETTDIEILKGTDHLKLHSGEIDIKKAQLTLSDGSVLQDLDIEYHRKWTTVTLKLPKHISPQKAKISLDFVGELNEKMRGFYRSPYKDVDGKECYLAATQFESTFARLAFPCWDEPIYKAKFDVTLIVDEGLTALSNMNMISETKVNDKKVVKFATTPPMSTYLVAFAVGQLEYIEGKTNRNCTVRLYTSPGKKNQGKFSLEVGIKALDWYSKWFGIDYPLPKCDLIAIPDFSMGAMENWGLVTYREVALLVDPTKSSTRQKSRIALVVAHELAHFWFGDLVTMKWWTDLWLKEGFASFMEYVFVGANYPDFKIWLHFVNDELASGFDLDALRSSHPIEIEIDNPNELDEIYDNITYAKSNSINRMLCNYLGEETFQKALRIYLKRFQYNNAVTADLWKALSEASGQDIETLMSTWTKQMGYPLVSVSQKIDGRNRILRMNQKRFLADGTTDEKNSLWQIPITISVSSEPESIKERVLLKGFQQDVTVNDVDPKDWIKLNVGTTGFYRVLYSHDMLHALLPDFATKKIPVLDRFGIANDMFALVKSGRESAKQFLSLLKSSSNEDDYTVWSSLDSGISELSNVLSHYDPVIRSKFNKFIIKILTPVADRLGWEAKPNEDSQIALLRALILGRLGRCDHEETIKTAREKFLEHIRNKTELHPDLRLTIYGMMGRHYGKEGFQQLKEIYETAGFGEIERNCIVAMPQTSDTDLLKEVFEYCIQNGKIRSQDIIYLFYGACVNKSGQDFAWKYFKDSTKLLLQKFGGANSSLFQHCFRTSADCHCSSVMVKEVEDFVCSYLGADEARTINRTTKQIIESVHLNEQLLKRNADVISEYLAAADF